jgi:acyl carrier protein
MTMDLVDGIRSILTQDLSIAAAVDVAADVPLLQKGVIDSIELMQLIAALEAKLGIAIDETEILPANFRTLSAIAAFVARKQGVAAEAP